MALPDGFPGKTQLEKEGYESVSDVSEATDEELLAIPLIADGTLARIREVAPYTPSSDESGTGETSGQNSSTDLTKESFAKQTAVMAKDQTDEVGRSLPDGIVKNERGTFTASSTADQEDMVHPDQVKAEHQAALRRAGERIAALTAEV